MHSPIRGFTLIELMISMTIGIFLIGGVFAIYLETQSTRRVADMQARMQENGRFATMLVAEELKRAGYWGKTTYEGTLQGQNSNTPLSVDIGNDCNGTTTPFWALDLGKEIETFDNDNPYDATCLDDDNYLAGTDILVIRSASPEKWNDDTEIAGTASPPAKQGGPGKLFIRTDVNRGVVYEGGDTPPDPGGFLDHEDHRYNVSLFYVRPYADNNAGDNIPVLRRLVLADAGADPRVQNEGGEIARGVEDFQVQIGVTNGSNVRFVDPGSSSIEPDKSNIVAVRFWLLVRAETEEAGYINSIRYVYADQDRTFNDGYRRMLFNRTVQTRNLAEIS
ncbi:MAG: PilW family protein [Proteobacteria bacterium]|nr:PilW family protein [Pseudomonadota bacterium]